MMEVETRSLQDGTSIDSFSMELRALEISTLSNSVSLCRLVETSRLEIFMVRASSPGRLVAVTGRTLGAVEPRFTCGGGAARCADSYYEHRPKRTEYQ